MTNLKYNHLSIILIYIFVIINFFIVNGDISTEFTLAFYALFILYIISKNLIHSISIERTFEIRMYFLLICLTILIVLFSQYKTIYTIQTTAFTGIILLVFNRSTSAFIHPDSDYSIIKFKNIIINLMILIALCQWIFLISDGILGFSVTYENILILGRDKNNSGVIIYLLFAICKRLNKTSGIVVSFMYAIVLHSRLLLLAIVLTYICATFGKQIDYFFRHYFRGKIFLMIIFMGIILVGFSYYWVYVVSSQNVVAYQAGINDTSNRIRFIANVNAINVIMSDPSLLLYGYDLDIWDILGANSGETFLGARIVQPHNDILNMILRCGVLYSFIYWIILSKVIQPFLNTETWQYVIPFFVESLVLTPILVGPFCLFWLLVIYNPGNTKHRKPHIPFNT